MKAAGFVVGVLTVLAAAFLFMVQQRLASRWSRLVAAVPLLAFFGAAPLLVSPVEDPATLVACLNFPWMSNCEILAWVAGKGPLSQPLPFRAFFAFLATPALPAAPGSPDRYRLRPAAVLAKVALLLGAAHSLACHRLPPLLMGVLQSVALYLFASLAMEGAAAVASLLSGMPVVTPFDRPFLASSPSEFWRRWNAVPGLKFRSAIYEPFCTITAAAAAPEAAGSVAAGRRSAPAAWRRLAGVCAVFAASGAVHELCFYYLTRRLSGHWMLFFVLQGPLLSAEAWLRALGRQTGICVPPALRTAATLALLHDLAQRLFFPDLVASGVPARLLAQLWPAQVLGRDICWSAWH